MSIHQKENRIVTKRQYMCAAVVMCVIALAAAAFLWRVSNASTGRDVRPIESARSYVDVQSAARTNAVDAEHLTLRATGFEPAEFTRPAGRFLLAIDNQTQMGEMSFRVMRESGLRERELPAKKQRFRLRQIIDLAPGHYSLVVVNHPGDGNIYGRSSLIASYLAA